MPTTYAGSEQTPIYGLTGDRHKQTGRTSAVLPRAVIYDPELTVGLPPACHRAERFNALAHSVEALWVPEAQPGHDRAGARRRPGDRRARCPAVMAAPGDLDARPELLYGAYLSGVALGAARRPGCTTSSCHVLGGTFGLVHADTHAVMLPHAVAFNAHRRCPRRWRRLAERPRRAGRRRRRRVVGPRQSPVGVPTSLADLGLHRATTCRRRPRRAAAEITDNPRPVTEAELLGLLQRAYAGARPAIDAAPPTRGPDRTIQHRGQTMDRTTRAGRHGRSDRRTLPRRSAAVALVAAVLAACGKDDDDDAGRPRPSATTGRRLRATTATTAADAPAGAPATTAARAGGITGGGGGDGTIKIGWVSPSTGPLAPFAAADDFIIGGIEEFLADGLMVGGKSYTVEIIRKDSESVPDTAASVALELINDDQIDLMLVGNTPETTNPVSDQCEANGVPCISSLAPVAAVVHRPRRRARREPVRVDVPLLLGARGHHRRVHRDVGPARDEQDRSAGCSPTTATATRGATPSSASRSRWPTAGYTIVDPGRYENGNQDFTAQINAFKDADCEIVTGVVIPPDFPTFWQPGQAAGLRPEGRHRSPRRCCSPSRVEALGDDGTACRARCGGARATRTRARSSASTRAGPRRRVHRGDRQPVDAADRLRPRAVRGGDRRARGRRQHRQGGGPRRHRRRWPSTPSSARSTGRRPTTRCPNVAKTKLVGGQWRTGRHADRLSTSIIVDNTGNPDVPTGGTMEAITA